MAARALYFAARKARMAVAAPGPRVAPFAPLLERRGPLAPALAGSRTEAAPPLPSHVAVDDALAAEILINRFGVKKTLGEAAAVVLGPRVAPLAPAVGRRSLFAAAPALAEPHVAPLLPPLPRRLLAPCSAAGKGKGAVLTGVVAGGEGAGLVVALPGVAPVRTAWRPISHNELFFTMKSPSFTGAGLGMARRGYASGSDTDDGHRDDNIGNNVPESAGTGGDHGTAAFGAGESKRTGPRGRAYRKRLLRPRDRKRDAEIQNLKRMVIRLSKTVSTLADFSSTFRTEVAVNSKSMLRHIVFLPFTDAVVLLGCLSFVAYLVITEVVPNVLMGLSKEVPNMMVQMVEDLKKAGIDDEKLKLIMETVRNEFGVAIKKIIKDWFKFWRWFF